MKPQTRLRRAYKFPDKPLVMEEVVLGSPRRTAWIAISQYDTNLYGVIRYLVSDNREEALQKNTYSSEQTAWIESNSFGKEREKVTAWIHMILSKLRKGETVYQCDNCHEIVDAIYDATPDQWHEGKELSVCGKCHTKVTEELIAEGYTFGTELKDVYDLLEEE